MITLIARIKSKSGKENELREELLALVSPARAEKGCIEYILHTVEGDPSSFLFYETWKDQEAFDAHVKTEIQIAFSKKKAALADGDFEVVFLRKL